MTALNTNRTPNFYKLQYRHIFAHFKGQGRTVIDNHCACRFCGDTKPINQGWKKAHSIPAFLGNTEIFSYDECSKCNKLFADYYEDNLSKYTNFFRSITKTKGRKIPKAKSKGLTVSHDNEQTHIKGMTEGSIVNDGENILVNFEGEAYSPLMVWKSFVKCGISVLPTERLSSYQETIATLLEPKSTPAMKPCFIFTASAPWIILKSGLSCLLFEKTTANESKFSPDLVLIIIISGVFYHIPIFSDNQIYEFERNKDKVEINLPPITDYFGLENHVRRPKLSVYDMSSLEKITSKQTVTLTPNGPITTKKNTTKS